MNEEVKARTEAFMKEYGELVKKHDIDFANYPMFVPEQGGSFKVIVQSTPVDIRGRGIPSPFVQPA